MLVPTFSKASSHEDGSWASTGVQTASPWGSLSGIQFLSPRTTVRVFPSERELSAAFAARIAAVVCEDPKAVVGFATGDSPKSTYEALAALKIPFGSVVGVNLDEYVGIPPEDPGSYVSEMLAVHSQLGLDIRPRAGSSWGNALIPNFFGRSGSIEALCADFERQIAEIGGVRLQILGIGPSRSPHIAFNEPGTSFCSRTHIAELSPETRLANAKNFGGDLDKVPTHAATQGLGTIMGAKEIGLIALGRRKAEAVRDALLLPAHISRPASVLQFHQNVTFYLDREAASLLDLGLD